MRRSSVCPWHADSGERRPRPPRSGPVAVRSGCGVTRPRTRRHHRLPAVCKCAGLASRGGRVTIWLDAHLSPSLAPWVAAHCGVECVAVRDLGLRDALDPPIFDAARAASASVMTKDADFARMVERLGPPPHILWLRCGNTSNSAMKNLLATELAPALKSLSEGAAIVEIGASA